MSNISYRQSAAYIVNVKASMATMTKEVQKDLTQTFAFTCARSHNRSNPSDNGGYDWCVVSKSFFSLSHSHPQNIFCSGSVEEERVCKSKLEKKHSPKKATPAFFFLTVEIT